MENLKKLITRFSKVKILIIGDVMLDRYWWGSVSRISPEAPVPVVRLEKTSLVPGGAANVAVNVATLGANPRLIGVIGDDSEGKYLAATLAKSNISPDLLLALEDRPTTVKTRIVAHNQHVVRIDNEKTAFLSEEQEEALWRTIENELDKADLILISDYAKGLLGKNLLSRLITTVRENDKHILVDPKGKDYSKYAGATLLTPNRREAIEACNFEDNHAGADINAAGEALISQLGLEAVLITQGEHGMTLFQKDEKPAHFQAKARTVYDVTGAGDTVIATLAVALAAGANLLQAAELSNISAGLVVEEVGTTTISQEKLLEALD
ncbi:MAG TPA: D-glycero-beta-D-manno-heptose-7-phosphate kinase [Pyrinomonadaceae bacterium]|nr:D-glycero-beta-D-manno-heptose-7-phosphate kinase [Pyrinomonadaceae bacterium]